MASGGGGGGEGSRGKKEAARRGLKEDEEDEGEKETFGVGPFAFGSQILIKRGMIDEKCIFGRAIREGNLQSSVHLWFFSPFFLFKKTPSEF